MDFPMFPVSLIGKTNLDLVPFTHHSQPKQITKEDIFFFPDYLHSDVYLSHMYKAGFCKNIYGILADRFTFQSLSPISNVVINRMHDRLDEAVFVTINLSEAENQSEADNLNNKIKFPVIPRTLFKEFQHEVGNYTGPQSIEKMEFTGSSCPHFLRFSYMEKAFAERGILLKELLPPETYGKFKTFFQAIPNDTDTRIILRPFISRANLEYLKNKMIALIANKIPPLNDEQVQLCVRILRNKFPHKYQNLKDKDPNLKYFIVKELGLNKLAITKENDSKQFFIISIGDPQTLPLDIVVGKNLQNSFTSVHNSLLLPFHKLLGRKKEPEEGKQGSHHSQSPPPVIIPTTDNGSGLQALSDNLACILYPPPRHINDKRYESQYVRILSGIVKGNRPSPHSEEFIVKEILLNSQYLSSTICDLTKNCLDNHYKKKPEAALFLTLQACFSFQKHLSKSDFSNIVKEMSARWQNLSKHHENTFFATLEALLASENFQLIHDLLQIVAFIQMQSPSDFLSDRQPKATLTWQDPLAIQIDFQDYHLLFPFNPSSAFENLEKHLQLQKGNTQDLTLFKKLLNDFHCQKPIKGSLTSPIISAKKELQMVDLKKIGLREIPKYLKHSSSIIQLLGYQMAFAFESLEKSSAFCAPMLTYLPQVLYQEKDPLLQNYLIGSLSNLLREVPYNLELANLFEGLRRVLEKSSNPVDIESEWILLLAKEGVLFLSQLAFSCWKEHKSSPALSLRLFSLFLTSEHSMAMSILHFLKNEQFPDMIVELDKLLVTKPFTPIANHTFLKLIEELLISGNSELANQILTSLADKNPEENKKEILLQGWVFFCNYWTYPHSFNLTKATEIWLDGKKSGVWDLNPSHKSVTELFLQLLKKWQEVKPEEDIGLAYQLVCQMDMENVPQEMLLAFENHYEVLLKKIVFNHKNPQGFTNLLQQRLCALLPKIVSQQIDKHNYNEAIQWIKRASQNDQLSLLDKRKICETSQRLVHLLCNLPQEYNQLWFLRKADEVLCDDSLKEIFQLNPQSWVDQMLQVTEAALQTSIRDRFVLSHLNLLLQTLYVDGESYSKESHSRFVACLRKLIPEKEKVTLDLEQYRSLILSLIQCKEPLLNAYMQHKLLSPFSEILLIHHKLQLIQIDFRRYVSFLEFLLARNPENYQLDTIRNLNQIAILIHPSAKLIHKLIPCLQRFDFQQEIAHWRVQLFIKHKDIPDLRTQEYLLHCAKTVNPNENLQLLLSLLKKLRGCAINLNTGWVEFYYQLADSSYYNNQLQICHQFLIECSTFEQYPFYRIADNLADYLLKKNRNNYAPPPEEILQLLKIYSSKNANLWKIAFYQLATSTQIASKQKVWHYLCFVEKQQLLDQGSIERLVCWQITIDCLVSIRSPKLNQLLMKTTTLSKLFKSPLPEHCAPILKQIFYSLIRFTKTEVEAKYKLQCIRNLYAFRHQIQIHFYSEADLQERQIIDLQLVQLIPGTKDAHLYQTACSFMCPVLEKSSSSINWSSETVQVVSLLLKEWMHVKAVPQSYVLYFLQKVHDFPPPQHFLIQILLSLQGYTSSLTIDKTIQLLKIFLELSKEAPYLNQKELQQWNNDCQHLESFMNYLVDNLNIDSYVLFQDCFEHTQFSYFITQEAQANLIVRANIQLMPKDNLDDQGALVLKMINQFYFKYFKQHLALILTYASIENRKLFLCRIFRLLVFTRFRSENSNHTLERELDLVLNMSSMDFEEKGSQSILLVELSFSTSSTLILLNELADMALREQLQEFVKMRQINYKRRKEIIQYTNKIFEKLQKYSLSEVEKGELESFISKFLVILFYNSDDPKNIKQKLHNVLEKYNLFKDKPIDLFKLKVLLHVLDKPQDKDSEIDKLWNSLSPQDRLLGLIKTVHCLLKPKSFRYLLKIFDILKEYQWPLYISLKGDIEILRLYKPILISLGESAKDPEDLLIDNSCIEVENKIFRTTIYHFLWVKIQHLHENLQYQLSSSRNKNSKVQIQGLINLITIYLDSYGEQVKKFKEHSDQEDCQSIYYGFASSVFNSLSFFNNYYVKLNSDSKKILGIKIPYWISLLSSLSDQEWQERVVKLRCQAKEFKFDLEDDQKHSRNEQQN